MIETNKIWNQPWLEYDVEQKLDALKDVIKDVVEKINSWEDTPARAFMTKEEVERELSQMFHNIHADMEERVDEKVEEWTSSFKHDHKNDMDEAQKVIIGLKERLEKLEK